MIKPTKSHGRLSMAASLKPRDLMGERPRLAHVWMAKVMTLYPDMFPGVLGQSLTGRALHDGLWQLETVNIREFGKGKHRDVDDTPAGGGAGMVLRADVLHSAIKSAQDGTRGNWPLVYLSPRGKPFTQAMARRYASCDGVTFLCGRFEGVDQRVLDHHQIEEVSLGDFVMTGGEIAAQALIDATVRLIPRVLGNAESTEEESFSNGLLEHDQYTRPTDWNGLKVPEILLSGHHGRIADWRRTQSEDRTKERRPDLWRAYVEGPVPDTADPAGDAQLSDAKTFVENDGHKDD